MARREVVERFADLMEERLLANDAEKGEDGWKSLSVDELRMERMVQSVKLGIALQTVPLNRGKVRTAAAGVANLAMMIADNVGGLRAGT